MTRAVTQVTAEDLAAWWPVPGADSHKYTRGVVGIDTGSEDYPGAALLSIAGALGAGPGMARYLGTAPRDLILGRFPSVVLVPGQVQALVVGSGWGQRPDAEARLSGAVSRGVPLLVDADALQLLPAHLPPESLLTPHAGELARMLSMRRAEVEADPVAAAREAARAFGYRGVKLFTTVQLPAVLPSVVSGLRLALAQAWLFLVAAELLGASMGLGYLLTDSQNNGRTDRLLLAIVLLAVLGKLTDALIGVFERWVKAKYPSN